MSSHLIGSIGVHIEVLCEQSVFRSSKITREEESSLPDLSRKIERDCSQSNIEVENERFSAAGLGCRQNLKIHLRAAHARFFDALKLA